MRNSGGTVMETLFNSVHFSTESEMRIIDIDIRAFRETNGSNHLLKVNLTEIVTFRQDLWAMFFE